MTAIPFITGRVLDAGGGIDAKYKSIIISKAEEYICFDIKSGGNVDIVGDVLNMPFQEEDFDTVICNQVLEHVPEPEKLIAESYRVLKSGGHFILTAPFLSPIHADLGDFFRYTKEGLEFMFKKYNFDVIKAQPYGGLFSVIYSFIKFTLFNPYKPSIKNKRRTARYIEKFFIWLDTFHQTPQKIYSNCLIIGQKI